LLALVLIIFHSSLLVEKLSSKILRAMTVRMNYLNILSDFTDLRGLVKRERITEELETYFKRRDSDLTSQKPVEVN